MEIVKHDVEETAKILANSRISGKHNDWLKEIETLEPNTSFSFTIPKDRIVQSYRSALTAYLKRHDVLVKLILKGQIITIVRLPKLDGQV